MTSTPVLVVDVANVMGSRADGWWRDRAEAARRLVDEVRAGVGQEHEVVLVLEGRSRSGAPATDDALVRVVHASGDGDDAVVDQAAALVGQGREVTVVTADHGLRDRVAAVGAGCRGPRWLLERLS